MASPSPVSTTLVIDNHRETFVRAISEFDKTGVRPLNRAVVLTELSSLRSLTHPIKLLKRGPGLCIKPYDQLQPDEFVNLDDESFPHTMAVSHQWRNQNEVHPEDQDVLRNLDPEFAPECKLIFYDYSSLPQSDVKSGPIELQITQKVGLAVMNYLYSNPAVLLMRENYPYRYWCFYEAITSSFSGSSCVFLNLSGNYGIPSIFRLLTSLNAVCRRVHAITSITWRARGVLSREESIDIKYEIMHLLDNLMTKYKNLPGKQKARKTNPFSTEVNDLLERLQARANDSDKWNPDLCLLSENVITFVSHTLSFASSNADELREARKLFYFVTQRPVQRTPPDVATYLRSTETVIDSLSSWWNHCKQAVQNNFHGCRITNDPDKDVIQQLLRRRWDH